ncbi:MAG: hypothetical protein COA79_14855 [Planctomycetota bacterium]|nr:MAG: hypothetical protein COA79_14855 [Planctomycetota bacterium]
MTENENLDDNLDEMTSYYGQLAPRYESKQGKDVELSEDHQKYWKTLFSCFQKHVTGCNILEIGCGPGTWTQQLAGVAQSVMATDYNESTLVEARKKTYHYNNVQFLQADAYDLSNVEGEFNVGFAKDWFSHIPISKVNLFFDAFHKKIGIGGKVILADTYYKDPRVPEEPKRFSHIDDEGNIYHNRRIPGDPENKMWKIIKNCPTEDEMRSYLKDRANDIDYHIHDTWSKRSDWCITYTITH